MDEHDGGFCGVETTVSVSSDFYIVYKKICPLKTDMVVPRSSFERFFTVPFSHKGLKNYFFRSFPTWTQ